MFKIGEFSKLTQVTIRMLRYYDEEGLLKPEEIDPFTGYRLYSAEQIPALNKIIYLRDSGFQVAEIAAALREDNEALVARLDGKHWEIELAMLREQEKLHRLELAKRELLQEQGEMHYNVTIKSIPDCQVLSIRRVIPDYYAEGNLWKELSEFVRKNRIAVSNETFSIYHDPEYKERDVDVELCAPVKAMGKSTDGFTYRSTGAVPFMASTLVYGDFSNIAGAYRAFAEWLGENSRYQMGPTSRQIVHRGPWNEPNPEHYLTELQIPLEKIKSS